MNQIKHKHDWQVLTSAQYTNSGKDYPAVFECKGCNLKLHASDAIQFELWKHTTSWQKWLSIVAIIISVLALLKSHC